MIAIVRWSGVLVLLCVVAGGCKGKGKSEDTKGEGNETRPPAQKPAPPVDAVGSEYVLVKDSATLYVSASKSAASFRVSSEPRGSVYPFRLVGKTGAWFELETAGVHTGMLTKRGALRAEPEAEHCAEELEGLRAFRLRVFLYVDADALVSVVSKPVDESFPDGTGFRLAVGVPLGPPQREDSDAGSVVVRAVRDRDHFAELAVPVSAVGTSYRPPMPVRKIGALDALKAAPRAAQRPDAAPRPARRYAQRGTKGIIGGRQVVLGEGAMSNVGVSVEADKGSSALVRTEGKCVNVSALVPTNQLTNSDGLGRINFGKRAAREGPTAKRGAAVYWSDGSAAGHVHREVRVGKPAPAVGSRRCYRFDANTRTDADPLLILCYDPDQLSAP